MGQYEIFNISNLYKVSECLQLVMKIAAIDTKKAP